MNKYISGFIIAICFYLSISYISFAADICDKNNKDAVEFVTDMSEKALMHYCDGGNKWFLKFTKLNNNECRKQIIKASKECNKIAIILMPPISINDEYVIKNANKVKNLSTLYQMCLKTIIYEDVKR